MNFEEKFESNPNEFPSLENNCFIKGTKFPVSEILKQLSDGKSINEIIKEQQGIEISDIYACLAFAAELVGAIRFEKSMSIITTVRKNRKAIADRIRSFKVDDFDADFLTEKNDIIKFTNPIQSFNVITQVNSEDEFYFGTRN